LGHRPMARPRGMPRTQAATKPAKILTRLAQMCADRETPSMSPLVARPTKAFQISAGEGK